MVPTKSALESPQPLGYMALMPMRLGLLAQAVLKQTLELLLQH